MRITEDRISHISHLIWDALYDDDLVDYPDESKSLIGIKRIMTAYLQTDDEIDDFVRKRIESLSRSVPEGSREWDILYQKYYEEEASRRNF